MIDIYHSRRTKFERVPYYTDKPDRALNEWVLKAKPAGWIYCQPVDMRNLNQNQVNNAMMFDKDSIVLLTSDDCDGLSRGSVILYRGHPWIVDNLRQELHLKESQYGHEHYETFIYLRK